MNACKNRETSAALRNGDKDAQAALEELRTTGETARMTEHELKINCKTSPTSWNG